MRFFGIAAGLMIPLFLVRLVMDSSVRMVYPFLPQFAAGAHLSIADYGWMISLRSWIGFLSPVMGIAADRYGQRAVMVFGLAALTLGFIGLLTLSGWWVAAPMLLLGIASSAFIPTQQAFVSDQAVFARRARALAAVDISFSLTGMLLVPLMGWMIDTIDWRAPFAVLAALSALAIPVIAFRLPAGRHTRLAGESRPALKTVLTRPNVLAM
jgi:predicted MFS family arabinose efflux permease